VYRAEAELQEAVESFATIEKRYPASLSELAQHDDSVRGFLKRLSVEQVVYERDGDRDYKLTFRAGSMHPRDEDATHEFKLRSVVDQVEKEAPFP
jgi:hypothetical protein